jgi:hypothetical protein
METHTEAWKIVESVAEIRVGDMVPMDRDLMLTAFAQALLDLREAMHEAEPE